MAAAVDAAEVVLGLLVSGDALRLATLRLAAVALSSLTLAALDAAGAVASFGVVLDAASLAAGACGWGIDSVDQV